MELLQGKPISLSVHSASNALHSFIHSFIQHCALNYQRATDRRNHLNVRFEAQNETKVETAEI